MRLVVTELAANDVEEHKRWYNNQRAGLGEEFVGAVYEQFERIANSPRAFAHAGNKARRAPVGKFPYRIVFRIRESSIEILAIAHTSRHPRTWKRRI